MDLGSPRSGNIEVGLIPHHPSKEKINVYPTFLYCATGTNPSLWYSTNFEYL